MTWCRLTKTHGFAEVYLALHKLWSLAMFRRNEILGYSQSNCWGPFLHSLNFGSFHEEIQVFTQLGTQAVLVCRVQQLSSQFQLFDIDGDFPLYSEGASLRHALTGKYLSARYTRTHIFSPANTNEFLLDESGAWRVWRYCFQC